MVPYGYVREQNVRRTYLRNGEPIVLSYHVAERTDWLRIGPVCHYATVPRGRDSDRENFGFGPVHRSEWSFGPDRTEDRTVHVQLCKLHTYAVRVGVPVVPYSIQWSTTYYGYYSRKFYVAVY